MRPPRIMKAVALLGELPSSQTPDVCLHSERALISIHAALDSVQSLERGFSDHVWANRPFLVSRFREEVNAMKTGD